MHRTTLRGLAGALTLAVAAGGAAAVPAAGGSAAAPTPPKVIKVSTDSPVGRAEPRNAGVPVNPFPHRVEQPDGTAIVLRAWGDSQTNGYETKGGYAVTKDADGVWRYVVKVDSAGRPVASSLEVGKVAAPAAARAVRATVVARTASSRTSVERAPAPATAPSPAW
jgi:hypothetical protein